jgi:hypothetical protein
MNHTMVKENKEGLEVNIIQVAKANKRRATGAVSLKSNSALFDFSLSHGDRNMVSGPLILGQYSSVTNELTHFQQVITENFMNGQTFSNFDN